MEERVATVCAYWKKSLQFKLKKHIRNVPPGVFLSCIIYYVPDTFLKQFIGLFKGYVHNFLKSVLKQ